MLKVRGPVYRIFLSPFGNDPDYFRKKPGRFCFYPGQLKRRHDINWYQAVRLSAVLNVWLSLLDTLKLPYPMIQSMKNCTWRLSGAREVVPYSCHKRICPWCQGLRVLQICGWLKKQSYRLISREGDFEDMRKVFRLPRTKPGSPCIAVRNVQVDFCYGKPVLVCRALYFVGAREPIHTENKDHLVQTLLMPSLSLLQHPVLEEYMTKTKGLSMVFRKNVHAH